LELATEQELKAQELAHTLMSIPEEAHMLRLKWLKLSANMNSNPEAHTSKLT
jgi:hypothetical protein